MHHCAYHVLRYNIAIQYSATLVCVSGALSIQGVFPSKARYSRERFRIHYDPDRDKVLTEDERR